MNRSIYLPETDNGTFRPLQLLENLDAGAEHIVMRVKDWPAADRALWEAGTARRDGTRLSLKFRSLYAEQLRQISIDLAWKSYGRFLHILAERGELDPAAGPTDRVTFDAVAVYFDALRAAGNIDNTIKARMFHLRTALHIMTPRQDFGWITRPDDVSLDSLLLAEPDPNKFVVPSPELFRWGLRLMDIPALDALPEKPETRMAACQDFRNGLIIALLACRAPRLGSLSQMCVGKNLYLLNGEYWARLQSQIVKNKRELEYSLPAKLTPYIDRYLAEVRPVLIDTTRSDALWGNSNGGAFTYRSIQTMINRQTLTEFGASFGPHRFRDSFASTLAAADPRNPGLAAVLLGITEQVVNEHYRKGRQADAARKLQANLTEERERTKLLARRAFGARTS
jgi:hypothetical protein